jgi:SAM-dependent methyltransferase
MENLQLLVNLHAGGCRQGPGGEEQTRLAIELSGLRNHHNLKIADIGCGTGASTLILARELDAHIQAIDMLPEFLTILEARACAANLAVRITTEVTSMDKLAIEPHSLDAIWSEGAIYNLGFEKGVHDWRRLLKPGGILAVSELTWLTDSRPAELETHWKSEYPQVDTASAKIAILEQHGFTLMGYFPLPEQCWLDGYYTPMRQRFPHFLQAHGTDETQAAAKVIVAAEEREIDLYQRHKAYISYGFYIARKTVREE